MHGTAVASEYQIPANLSARESRAQFNETFRARVRAARQNRGLSQAAIAGRLDLKPATYGTYETRSLLPHHLIAPFCRATGIAVDQLFLPDGPPGNRQRQAQNDRLAAAIKQAVCVWLAIEFALADMAEKSGPAGVLEFRRRPLPSGLRR